MYVCRGGGLIGTKLRAPLGNAWRRPVPKRGGVIRGQLGHRRGSRLGDIVSEPLFATAPRPFINFGLKVLTGGRFVSACTCRAFQPFVDSLLKT